MLGLPLWCTLRANDFDGFYTEYVDRFKQNAVACRRFFDHLKRYTLRIDSDDFFNAIEECGRNLHTKTPEEAKRIFDKAALEIDKKSQLRMIPEGVLDKLDTFLENNNYEAARRVVAQHRPELTPEDQSRMIGYQLAGVTDDSGRRAASGRLLDGRRSWPKPRDINLTG